MMDRNREARRAATMLASSNGLPRRRHRSNSLRDSPDEDGAGELQESVRLRERVKKDRDRDRDRDRERDRERDRDREQRERERERSSRSSKRRRGERLMIHGGSNRDEAGEDSSEESVNDDEDDEEDDHNHNNNHSTNNNSGHHNSGGIGGGGVRLLPPNPNMAASAAVSSISNHYNSGNSNNHHHHHHNSSSNSNINHQQQHHLQHRKSFPPSTAAKVFRAAPVWKPGDEMIGVSVPRKARSASIKRSHDWMSSTTGGNTGGGGLGVGGGGGEQIHRQASTSPVRQSIVSTATQSPSPAAPVSPSSSNASIRKKIKPNGSKQPRPPKSSSKASSSNPEELEIEIAEVLYGLKTQSQAAPPKKEILSNDSAEVNRSSSDAKSRVSSPISNSPSNIQSSPAILPPNSSSSPGPLSASAAPKRKRPRQVSENPGSFGVRNSPISSATAKVETEQAPKAEMASPNLEKTPGSAAENGYDMGNLVNPQVLPPEPMKVDSESKPLAEGLGESRDVIPKEEVMMTSPKKEFAAVRAEETNLVDAVTATATALASVTKATSDLLEVNTRREEKFQIDLEAPPPQLRSSPEREGDINLSMDHKPITSNVDAEMRPVVAKENEDEKVVKIGKEDSAIVVADEKKTKLAFEESELPKRVENRGRNIDLHLDLEKPERDNGIANKLPLVHKQQLPPAKAAKEEPHAEKTGHSSSLPLPMSMASWPGGLPPMGYMAPIQGVVSMDGSTVSPAPIQPFFSQPRPKRCATHCYIARNIHYLQQLMKMNPFWPAAAGSASLFGSKPCNMNVVPPADLHANIAGRPVNSAQDKAQGLAMFPTHGGKDKSSQPSNVADASQRKQQQILLQQALPSVAPNNILHGPAFIFPLNQQPAAVAAAAASARPGTAKPPAATGIVASSSASNSAAASGSATAGGAATAVSFNYPNMPANETQYLAILQNNAYPFQIPAVGAPPNYRGTHPQPLPLFNGSFYSSQIIHPSQLQQQQQPVSQSQQMQQNHQNTTSISSGSSSSQKHLQGQQQRPAGTAIGSGSGNGNLHNFPAAKSRQAQQPQNQQITTSQARQLENEVAAEDSPSTAESRGARGPVNIYGQNFAMPIHPQNYALLATQAALAGTPASTVGSNQNEKKQQQPSQQGLKSGVDSLPPQTFAMSFASMNGTPSIDLSSMAQNHAILQSLPEATRHNIQMMAATAAAQAAQAQQRKNFRISEDVKTGGGDSSNTDDERKGLAGKSPATAGQSIAFSRSELTDASVSAAAATNVIDSSARSLNLASGTAWTSRSTMPSSVGGVSVSNAQLQAQHQPQQMILHKQQLAARSKNPVTSNGSVYPEHMSSTSPAAAKFPNSLSSFPQNLGQTSNNSSPAQSPQWKNSAKPASSQAPSSFVSSTTPSLKNLPHQQGRTQQSHTQISFGANQKTSAPQGQQPPTNIQSPSSPMMVGSPSTSSMSKGASGSPRTATSASAGSKTGQASSLSVQQAKNSPIPVQKSSPVGGRNVQSILGNPHVATTSSSGSKPQIQQHQQQLPKNLQQAQLFFSNPYLQSQSPHSNTTNSTASAAGGYYIQRRRPDQQQHQPQQPPGSSSTSSTGMLTLCPVSLSGAGTSDPAKAIAAATVAANNMKGGGLPSQSILHAAQFAAQSAGNQHQLLPTGFPYVHTVPAAVQVKPAEQKQPAGNDNLHACWQPEKK